MMEDRVTLSQLDNIATQSLFFKEQSVCNRFEQPLSETDFKSEIAGRVPANTQRTTKWAVDIFNEWRMYRNSLEMTVLDTKWPIPDLKDGETSLLDYWLARFITEIKKQDGSPYPPGRYTFTQYM